MRIRTIKRNTNFLIKILQTRYSTEEEFLKNELMELMTKLYILKKKKDDLTIVITANSNFDTMGISKLNSIIEIVSNLCDTKSNILLNLQTHQTDIMHQIMEQSDMAVRKLLLELETGGNVRFEDEQREDPWFDRCEVLVKNFILRATHTPVQKRVQIHRISRIHNRYVKRKFENKLLKKPESERSNFEYLCFHSSDEHAEDIFTIIETGFKCIDENNSNRDCVQLTNYLECVDKEHCLGINSLLRRKRLKQAIIVKAFTSKTTNMSYDENSKKIDAKDFPGLDGVFKEINSKQRPFTADSTGSCNAAMDSCKYFIAFDGDLVLPEYFLEYSLESELDRLTTKVEKIMVDIAYSNKLSQSDMPAIITEISTRMTDEKIPLDENLAQIEKEYESIVSMDFDLENMHLSLEILDLRFNPVANRKGFRFLLAGILLHLKSLNCLEIEAHDKKNRPHTNEEWKKIITERVSSQSYMFRPLSVRTQAGHGSSAAQHEYWKNFKTELINGPFVSENITTLELDSCGLFNLDIVPTAMVNLRWASFRNNNFRDISKLVYFTKLEELSLENNEIEQIDCLSQLSNLSKLDVGNNQIVAVEHAANFKSLMHLSLENNFVKSLRPFVKLGTLMELYVGNNSIKDLYSIFPLKELPRLIILDLTDGAGISSKEQSSAKEAYMGKLTVELLGEKIGHFTFKNIAELDLRNCKLKEIDCFATGDFHNLRKINFDNNLLVALDPFLGLTALRCLSLNNNRIEKLLLADVACSASTVAGWVAPDGKLLSRTFLSHLEELHLGHNIIVRISDLGLFRIPSLKVLYLHGNRIIK
ncbi:Leucine-rich repeat-containing protein 9, partial [Nowakowskiella sp. JEL0078]